MNYIRKGGSCSFAPASDVIILHDRGASEPPKNLRQKPKWTTKVTITSHQKGNSKSKTGVCTSKIYCSRENVQERKKKKQNFFRRRKGIKYFPWHDFLRLNSVKRFIERGKCTDGKLEIVKRSQNLTKHSFCMKSLLNLKQITKNIPEPLRKEINKEGLRTPKQSIIGICFHTIYPLCWVLKL